MKYNNDFRHDLEVGQIGEKALGHLLMNKKIEVKTDFKAQSTGNVFVEYRSRGKNSGISTTEADYWCFIISKYQLILIDTDKLKDISRANWHKKTRGGDSNTSEGILIKTKDLLG